MYINVCFKKQTEQTKSPQTTKETQQTNLRNILKQLLSLKPPPQPNENDDAKGNTAPALQVLVATGSVASVKVPEIAKALVDFAEAQKMKGKA